MLIVAAGGLVVNIIMFMVLHQGSHSHGLMADNCDHDPEAPVQLSDICSQSVCMDTECLKLNTEEHCHDLEDHGKIHRHSAKLE